MDRLQEAIETRKATWASDARLTDRNVAVVTSTSESQISHVSGALRGSPFALAAAYALAGGQLANLDSRTGDATDEQITARELIRYCSETVSNWSLDNRGRTQAPKAFWFGNDFAVSAIDESVTLESILGTEDAELEKPQSDATQVLATVQNPMGAVQKMASKKGKTTKPSGAVGEEPHPQKELVGPAAPPKEGELEDVVGPPAGTEVETPTSSMALDAGQQEFINEVMARRVRQFDFIDNPKRWLDAQRTLSRVEALLIAGAMGDAKELFSRWAERDDSYRPKEPIGPATSFAAVVEKVLSEPSNKNLEALSEHSSFETSLLSPLARLFQRQNKWPNPEVIRLSVATRRLFVESANLNHWSFALVTDRLRAAERNRILGEIELFDGRFDEAGILLERARGDYQQAITDAERINGSLARVEATVASLPWLVAAVRNTSNDRNGSPLIRYFRLLHRFQSDPSVRRLRSLAAASRSLEDFCGDVSTELLASRQRGRLIQGLSQPNLSHTARETILSQLLNSRDSRQLRVGFSPGNDRRLLAGNSAAEEALDSLRHNDRKPATELASLFQSRVRFLLNSYWATDSHAAATTHQGAAQRIANEIAAHRQHWRSECLVATHRALPLKSSRSSALAGDSIFDKTSLDFTSDAADIVLKGQAKPAVDSTKQSASFSIAAIRSMPSDLNAKFVLQSFPTREITVGEQTSQRGRIELPLPELVRGSSRRFDVQFEQAKDATLLIGSVRLPNGKVYWDSQLLGKQSVEPPVARLTVEWPDEGATVGEVELMPNESLPVAITVDKLSSEVAGLSLEFVGDEVVQVPLAASKLLNINFHPGPEFRLPCRAGGFSVRLLHGETVLAERDVPVRVLDPAQCFRYSVSLDRARHRVLGDVVQLYKSDARQPVSFKFGLQDEGGFSLALRSAQALEFKKNQSGRLSASLPLSVREPYYVSLSAAGIPRAMRYTIRTGEPVEANRGRLLRIVSPEPATRYAVTEQFTLPLRLLADTPAREASVFCGIDENQNGRLEESERLAGGTYWHGRDSQLMLRSLGKPGRLIVESLVSDLQIDLDLSGYEGYLPLVAELDGVVTTDCGVHLIKTAPQMAVVWPTTAAEVPASKSLRVTVQADKRQKDAIDRVEFGFDLNNNGKLDAAEVTAPSSYSKFRANGQATVYLPTTKLKAGAVTLLTRATTNALSADGNEKAIVADVTAQTFQWITEGEVRGRVVLTDGSPVRGATVAIPGVGAKRTGLDGTYEFDGLRPGHHVLSAQTASRSGSAVVKVKPAQLTKADITIVVR